MGSKKRSADSMEESEDEQQVTADDTAEKSLKESQQSMKPMEKLKKRRALDKERHAKDSGNMETFKPKKSSEVVAGTPTITPAHGLRMDVFSDLASAECSMREAAAEALVVEVRKAQKVFKKVGKKGIEEGVAPLEAKKDEGFENCAPSVIYAIRRLVRGVSSSRECARQGFALGLAGIVGTSPSVNVESVMKLIEYELRVTAKMEGQDAREGLLGRLFAYGSLARSGRISGEWVLNNKTTLVKDFVGNVVSLAAKKRYLHEPAVSVILEVVEKLPEEAVPSQVLGAPGMQEWFENATDTGDPDVLFLALKLQERGHLSNGMVGKLLPCPFSSNSFFTRDHLAHLTTCFKESTFCLPRIHSLWNVLVNILVPETSHNEDKSMRSTSSRKNKKNRKGGCFEEVTKNIRTFCEVVIEDSLLMSSHDRKHLALDILLLLLPRLPVACVQIVLSPKLVLCLMDILSTKGSLLYNAAQHFVKELIKWTGDDDDRRVGVIVCLQKHSNGRFDCITRTQTVKELVLKFKTGSGCLLFVQNLMSLFVDEGALTDEPSDQSQTTDENSELGTLEDESPAVSEDADFLKKWVIDTMPRVLKNLRLNSNAKSLPHSELVKFIEEKFRVQTGIMKFLAVQGLFSASLGTEVTSFELQEKFKWPKAATSGALCRMCIEQLMHLLEDAQKGEVSHVLSSGLELNDLGSYFMCFLSTLCNIPSVSLYRTLNSEDEEAFKKLQKMESRLSTEARNIGPGPDANQLHALHYLLIQLLLQVLLHPGDFSEAALELVICCKKAFPTVARGDTSENDDEDDNDDPELMDVMVDTFLSLLPHTSGPMFYAIEQVFRFFCDDITEAGLLQMLRVVKKDLKPARHQAPSSDADEEDDDDFLAIEDAEETDNAEQVERGISDDHADDSEGMDGVEQTDEEVCKNVEVGSEGTSGDEGTDDEVDKKDEGNSGGRVEAEKTDKEASRHARDGSDSDESDDSDGMDDDAMFRMDSYLARIFKERKLASTESAHSQLMPFKLRVLSLLEIYLHRNPGKSQVMTIYSSLAQAFVNYHSVEGSEQLVQRIGAILQKKILKQKEYPKSEDIQLSTLETLLEKSLKSASRSRYKMVSSIAQQSTFWLLKIIQSRDFPKSELERVLEIFRQTLTDYFTNKKSRLKAGFVKDIIRRHPWIGFQLFEFLLEKCQTAKSEFRQVKSLELVDCIIKSWISANKGDEGKDAPSKPKFFKKHLPALCDLIHGILSNLPEKQSRRAEVRRFCSQLLHAISVLKLHKSFIKTLKPDAYSACESQLGTAFLQFKKLNE
ncbi:putative DNA-directed DNA polymerase [Dioscorea sansibarensis]